MLVLGGLAHYLVGEWKESIRLKMMMRGTHPPANQSPSCVLDLAVYEGSQTAISQSVGNIDA